ncbi:MAG: hypothetical protein J2P15_13395 [Micromonosporaceae bacterium]|nr:hypothetical protein [Micromonosporaceae bacterium]
MNWGLTPPPVPRYEPVFLVPRPPQPAGVRVAVLLTYCGVVISGILALVELIYLGSTSSLSEPARRVMTVFYVVVWLVPAAGAVVAAVFTGRGANAGRIVLAGLMFAYALINLCEGLSGFGYLANSPADGSFAGGAEGGPAGSEGGLVLLSFATTFVLAGLNIAAGVLLLRPKANRYFSPGPGRRWAPGG